MQGGNAGDSNLRLLLTKFERNLPSSEALDGANARSYFVSAVQRYCSRVEDLRQSLGRVFSSLLRNARVNFGFTKTLDFGELHVALRMMPAPFQRYDRVAFCWKILGQCVCAVPRMTRHDLVFTIVISATFN